MNYTMLICYFEILQKYGCETFLLIKRPENPLKIIKVIKYLLCQSFIAILYFLLNFKCFLVILSLQMLDIPLLLFQ